ncbi:MAG TPA: VWA domain-containing protein [Pyrinomonadaceae bacterium]|nr:VWA domain-containing protein [Pyrinomonadaceae bacterium]HMP66624.1 VWA domain-containing protein [Pyrinomonadaceae bacterium]
MKNLCFILMIVLMPAAAVQVSAQNPTSPPKEDGEVVRISTELIQIDVSVTDRRGNVIRDLRQDEIEIFENGRKQKITGFSFVSGETGTRPVSNVPREARVPSTLRPENVRRTFALVVDDLTLSFDSISRVRRTLKKFVDEQMEEGDLVAIVRTGAGMGSLQQFTSDRKMLHAAIEKVKWNPMGTGSIGAFPLMESRVDISQGASTAQERGDADFERDAAENRSNIYVSGTIGAMAYIVNGMRELPGRKSVMLFSDGFSAFAVDARGFMQANRTLESLRFLVDQANRAAVVIYAMDPRGLQPYELTAADSTRGRSIDQILQESRSRRRMIEATQGSLHYLARETGGFAITNQNDMNLGIDRMLNDQSYYLVAYEPDGDTFDPKTRRFNRLEVKVTRPATNVRYRSGFFGIGNEEDRRMAAASGGNVLSALSSPFAVNDISLKLNAMFGSGKVDGPFVRSLVHIEASDLKFDDNENGEKVAAFDIAAIAFGDNGSPVDSLVRSYTLTLNKEAYAQVLRDGFVYELSFPMKKPGGYQMRVAIRDSGSNRAGSAHQFVDVPDLKRKRLTMSGVVFENLTVDEWKARNDAGSAADPVPLNNRLMATSKRQFTTGTILNLGFIVFNGRTGRNRTPVLTSNIRLFRDGDLVFTGTPQPIPIYPGADPEAVQFGRSLVLGTELTAGDYVIEIGVTDENRKGKERTVSHFLTFEIVGG